MIYRLTASSSVVRLSDGACIPADPGNADWLAYQQWRAAGNTPLSAPSPDLQALVVSAVQAGTRTRPTVDEVLAQMPQLSWPA
jgi:hypothetical protein